MASGDSHTIATLRAVYDRSLRAAGDLDEPEPCGWAHVGSTLSLSDRFGIVHNHAGELPMALADVVAAPILTTAHCVPTADTALIWRFYRGAYNAVSADALARLAPLAECGRDMGFVHNAVDVESFPFSPAGGEDLLFLGRIGIVAQSVRENEFMPMDAAETDLTGDTAIPPEREGDARSSLAGEVDE